MTSCMSLLAKSGNVQNKSRKSHQMQRNGENRKMQETNSKTDTKMNSGQYPETTLETALYGQQQTDPDPDSESNSSRVSLAVQNFRSGFNCAQSLFAAYAELFGIDRETALRMTSSMGAGIGRMREVCGAVSSMSLLLGLAEGNADPEDEEAKARIYARTRELADSFRAQNGSIICRELLGMEGREQSAAPSARTPQYYATRPCAGLIASAAQILEHHLRYPDQPFIPQTDPSGSQSTAGIN